MHQKLSHGSGKIATGETGGKRRFSPSFYAESSLCRGVFHLMPEFLNHPADFSSGKVWFSIQEHQE
jgi:hypothetical protein